MGGGLNPEEESLLESIGEVWGKFIKLEQQHPSDISEFHQAVHTIQQLIGMRALRRDYPDYWTTHKELCKEGSKLCINCIQEHSGGRCSCQT